ncbi:hypothetical protein E8E11_004742 [Didymella keratinophila]|nr:hypothetical protein E8E11_004742 [Didymella keratinophila]
MDVPQFKHQPLGHDRSTIRVLCVQAELSAQGFIQCSMVHGATDGLSYSCLSYVWGRPLPAQAVLVNGGTCEVRQNLYDFLAHIQATADKSPLALYWIDAICIDQTNLPERNQQIAHMGDIYSRAECVYLWLGKLEGLHDFATFCQTHGNEDDIINLKAPDPTKVSVQVEQDRIRSKFVLNEYWERAWNIQELFLARRLLVVLRHEVVSLAQLYYGVVFLLSGLDDANFFKFAGLRKGDFQIAKDKSAAELLRDFAGKKCTVPRDHFYSVFALCEEREDLTVDYPLEKFNFVYHGLQILTEEIASGQEDLNGPFLQLDCIGFDAWFDPVGIAEAEDIEGCERFNGGLTTHAQRLENFAADLLCVVRT